MTVTEGSAAGPLARWAGAAGLGLALIGLTLAPARAEDLIGRVKDTCSIVRNYEVARVIGKIIKPADQVGPEQDPDNPTGTVTACSFEGIDGGITISELKMPTADDANAVIDKQIDDAKSNTDSDPAITEATGLGDRAYWITTSSTGAYVFRSNSVVMGVVIRWLDHDIDTSQPDLLKLAKTLLDNS